MRGCGACGLGLLLYRPSRHFGTVLLLAVSIYFPVQRAGLCRPPMLVNLTSMYSNFGIPCSFIFLPTYCQPDHPIDHLTTMTPYDRSSSSACLWYQALGCCCFTPSGHSTTAYGAHLLAIMLHFSRSLTTSGLFAAASTWSCSSVTTSGHNVAAFVDFPAIHVWTSSSFAVPIFSRSGSSASTLSPAAVLSNGF